MGGDLSQTVDQMYAAGADIAKVAVMARDAADLAVIEELIDSQEQSIIAIAMGEAGLPSRLLAGAWGAFATFGSVSPDAASAPGQPTVKQLVEDYRVREQGGETRIFGVIGDPISHSMSPAIHNAAFAHHKIDAVYVPFLVHDADAFWRSL